MSGIVAYIAVFLFTFFAESFLFARHLHADPTEPLNFLMLVGLSLVWPITIPLTTAIPLLVYIAKFATKLAGGAK